jgi:hypothetical protein
MSILHSEMTGALAILIAGNAEHEIMEIAHAAISRWFLKWIADLYPFGSQRCSSATATTTRRAEPRTNNKTKSPAIAGLFVEKLHLPTPRRADRSC